MVSTMKGESEGFSKRQIEEAKAACDFQAKVGHPSTQDLKSIVKSNLIVNCPVTAEDIDRVEKIYGPSVPILKGKQPVRTLFQLCPTTWQFLRQSCLHIST